MAEHDQQEADQRRKAEREQRKAERERAKTEQERAKTSGNRAETEQEQADGVKYQIMDKNGQVIVKTQAELYDNARKVARMEPIYVETTRQFFKHRQ